MRLTEPTQVLPLVSIVTPAYNVALTLEAAIHSVLAQDYASIEHVVVDGASSDGTLAILKCYSDRVTWLSEPDGGQSEALNKGLALARGEIIGWLNADDVYYPGAVGQAAAYLVAHPEVAMVYSDFDFIDERGRPLKRIPARKFSIEKLLFANIVPQATMFFRRWLLEDVGGVSTDYDYVMDWEFVLRAARRHRIRRISGVGGGFRLMAGTKSVAQAPKIWPEVIWMLERSSFLEERVPRQTLVDARRRAHLHAAIEFVRAGAMRAGRQHLEQALSDAVSVDERAVFNMLPGVLSTAVYPWHKGGVECPEADTCLEDLCQVLPNTGPGRHLTGLIRFYQGYRALKQLKSGLAARQWGRALRAWPGLWKDLRHLPTGLLTAIRP